VSHGASQWSKSNKMEPKKQRDNRYWNVTIAALWATGGIIKEPLILHEGLHSHFRGHDADCPRIILWGPAGDTMDMKEHGQCVGMLDDERKGAGAVSKYGTKSQLSFTRSKLRR
jgi:hypothetical protein